MILKIFNRISYEIKNFLPKPHMGNKKRITLQKDKFIQKVTTFLIR